MRHLSDRRCKNIINVPDHPHAYNKYYTHVIFVYMYFFFLLYVCGGTGRTIPKWATLFMSQTRALIRAFIRAWTTNSVRRRMCRGWRCKGHKNESKKNESKKSKEIMPAPSYDSCALRLTPAFFLALQQLQQKICASSTEMGGIRRCWRCKSCIRARCNYRQS